MITNRERELLETYIDVGHIPEAAARLGIAPTTARNQLYAMRRRLGARNTMQLVYMLATGELEGST